ncbi:hypothetical protein QAD02_000700 [Eretmocerus hayati]|uniref:Uncharacterized protein n=1 Tax=Eretmocerus hayati TaxID=131215 RepID=A0ACC2NEC0_9HYME|nr:hypothetical protein QAD02_000700 [Eretmocerus hayati]
MVSNNSDDHETPSGKKAKKSSASEITQNKGGRPPKRKHDRTCGGRPKILMKSASLSTKRGRAHQVADLAEFDITVMEIALKIVRKKSNIPTTSPKQKLIEPIIKHTPQTSVALCLDLDLSKRVYCALSKELRLRNAGILWSYPKLR